MNELQKDRIRRFLEDKIAVEAVKKVLLESFLSSKKDADVYVLAASRLAIDFLREGFKELDKYSEKVDERSVENEQNIGL